MVTELNSDQRQQILNSLQNGRKIEAIMHYRNFVGAGLREAKDFVDALIKTLETGELPPSDSGMTEELEQQIVNLLVDGKKIPAIKLYREANGTGLKEAKDAIEDVQRQLGIEVPTGIGCGASVLLLALSTSISAAIVWGWQMG